MQNTNRKWRIVLCFCISMHKIDDEGEKKLAQRVFTMKSNTYECKENHTKQEIILMRRARIRGHFGDSMQIDHSN